MATNCSVDGGGRTRLETPSIGDDFMIAFTAVLAISTLLLWWATRSMAKDARAQGDRIEKSIEAIEQLAASAMEANRIQREADHAALRPWVDFELTPLKGVLRDFAIEVDLELVVRNTGRAIAESVTWRSKPFARTFTPASEQPAIEFFDQPHPPGPGDHQMLPPGASFRRKIVIVIFHEDRGLIGVADQQFYSPRIAFSIDYGMPGSDTRMQTARTYNVGIRMPNIDTPSAAISVSLPVNWDFEATLYEFGYTKAL